ncbi:MAG: helix-turn-helix transcriptional regulator [Chloroflexota bacterium]|nr:helix-turn-helix transcriptional regulator [Chloroflexota bacterium]
MGSSGPQAELLERARRRLRNGISSGKPYPSLPSAAGVVKLLPGLLACRVASGLKQPELAQRAGIARETVARLERLRRRARPETVERLAKALSVPARSLMTATRDLPILRRSTRRSARHATRAL